MELTPGNFTEEAWLAIINAQEIAKEYRHQYIENEHISKSLINRSELVAKILIRSKVSIDLIQKRLDEFLSSKPRLKKKPSEVFISKGVEITINKSNQKFVFGVT